jgi:hypothetical protein
MEPETGVVPCAQVSQKPLFNFFPPEVVVTYTWQEICYITHYKEYHLLVSDI